MNLSTLKAEQGKLYLSAGENKLSQRLQNMGFSDGMQVIGLWENPGKTLCAFQMHNSIIALRTEDLPKIPVTLK